MKTKNKSTTTPASRLLSALLVLAVVLTATHAKEVAGQPLPAVKSNGNDMQAAVRANDDPVQKSMSDLHNHTDKTMLKNFAKSMGDASSLAARREERDDPADVRSLSHRLFETYLMLQFAYATATR